MAKRGPKSTSTKVVQMNGSWRASTRRYKPPPIVAPVCPRWMDTESRRIWERVTGNWDDGGSTAHIDSTALARYVAMFTQWQRLAKFLQEHGETYEVRHTYRVPERVDADGTILPRHILETTRQELCPEAKLALALADRLLRLEQQWGMSPRARVSIGMELTAARKVTSGHPLTLDPRRFLRLERPET